MNEYADSFGIYKLAVLATPASFAPSQVSLKTRWNTIGNATPSTGVIANSGNRGNPALYLPFGGSISRTLSRQATFTVGFRLNMGCVAGVGSNLQSLITFGAINTQRSQLADLLVKPDGSILVYGDGDVAKVIFTTAVVITANTNCYLEFSATITGTTNMNVAAEVRVNGVTVGSGNLNIGRNANTLASGVANFKYVELSSGVQTPGQAYISDFYINNGLGTTNTGFLAGTVAPYCQVDYLLPNADGTTLDWTPLGGAAHYTEIDEIPQDGGTSYVASAIPGNVDAYHWQTIATFSGTIPSVQISLCAFSTEEGLRTFQGNIGPTGAQQQTAEFGLCSGNFYRSASFDLDPLTGLAWLQAAFNARQFGIGVVR